MEGSRTYSFSLIIGFLLLSFFFGLGGGLFIGRHLYLKAKLPGAGVLSASHCADQVMFRRMQAIRCALKEGRSEYEFETGFNPPLSGGK